MAITYSVLTGVKTTTGSIASWVNRSDLPTDNILLEAEAWIYQRLRVREMVTDATFTFDDNTSSEALPSAFLDPIQFVPYEWGTPLPYVSPENFQQPRTSAGVIFDGSPSCWTIIGTTAHIDATIDDSDNYSGRLMYYAQPDALSSVNTTNFLTTRYPTLLRMACMGFAYQFMKDTPRTQEYLGYAMAAIQEAAATNDLYRRGQYA
jgi:hypothetical protein